MSLLCCFNKIRHGWLSLTVIPRDGNEYRNWYSNIRMNYSNIFEIFVYERMIFWLSEYELSETSYSPYRPIGI